MTAAGEARAMRAAIQSSAGFGTVEPEADGGSHPGHERDEEDVTERVGADTSGEAGRAGHRQCPEPVDHSCREVAGDGNAGLGGQARGASGQRICVGWGNAAITGPAVV
jgi:hypothetical protein